MPEQLRCACGAWDKIEEALNIFREKFKEEDRCVSLSWRLDGRWKGLCITDTGKLKSAGMELEIDHVEMCDLPAAILALRDKVAPPKPKEREWRVGDVLLCTDNYVAGFRIGDRAIVYELGERAKILKVGEDYTDNASVVSVFAAYFTNLTIEAENAGEK